jgi:hypothetical protein
MRRILGVVTIIAGIVTTLLFLNAAIDYREAGNKMMTLRSQSGDSLAELYYQDMGQVSKGHGSSAYAFALLTLSCSVGLGGYLIGPSTGKKSSPVES